MLGNQPFSREAVPTPPSFDLRTNHRCFYGSFGSLGTRPSSVALTLRPTDIVKSAHVQLESDAEWSKKERKQEPRQKPIDRNTKHPGSSLETPWERRTKGKHRRILLTRLDRGCHSLRRVWFLWYSLGRLRSLLGKPSRNPSIRALAEVSLFSKIPKSWTQQWPFWV